MARRKTKRSTRKKRKKTIAEAVPFRYLLFMALFVLMLSGIIYGLNYFFLNSSYFRVSSVVINNDRGYSLGNEESKLKKLYIGKNIFRIDLKYSKNMISRDLPQLEKVEVRREMPDVLVVDIFSRVPAGVIKTAGGIVVDKDGVVLTIGEGNKDLINITGLNYFLNIPERGERIKNESLDKALRMIAGIDNRMSRHKDRIEYVDISDSNNVVLGVEGVSVKMGTGDFLNKLSTLKQMINDPGIKFGEIKYIDLRFKDPVISPK